MLPGFSEKFPVADVAVHNEFGLLVLQTQKSSQLVNSELLTGQLVLLLWKMMQAMPVSPEFL